MAQTRALPQSKEALLKSYTKRLKDDVRSMLDNFTEIIKLARILKFGQVVKSAEELKLKLALDGIEEDSQLSKATQSEQDQYEMQVRAANIVRAGESLMKLVSDIKQYLILNDFPSNNESISQRTNLYKRLQADMDTKLMLLRDEMALELYDLEEEYYSSTCK